MRRIVFEQDPDDSEPRDELSASEWRSLRLALLERLKSLAEEEESATDERERMRLAKQVAEAREQVRALEMEEAVSKFAEDSEAYVIATGSVREELSRDPDAEIA